MQHRLTALVATAGLVGSVALAASPAQAGQRPVGERSLATVLAADGNRFDHNGQDFDILDRAVRTVLDAKPDSNVGLLADGSVRLTTFAPTDLAFRRLVTDLTGSRPASEKATFEAIAGTFDADTIETVLLYHVVPGTTVGYGKLRRERTQVLESAIGKHLRVVNRTWKTFVRDADRDDRNPRLVLRLKNLNKGNKQIAHGINRVLRPLNL